MSARLQTCLAILGGFSVLVLIAVANAHLLTVAFRSQPDCVEVAGEHLPAYRGC